jgi:hypothetical protein
MRSTFIGHGDKCWEEKSQEDDAVEEDSNERIRVFP